MDVPARMCWALQQVLISITWLSTIRMVSISAERSPWMSVTLFKMVLYPPAQIIWWLLPTNAANLTYTNGFINGNLRRYIASNTSTYTFPIANGTSATDRHLASILIIIWPSNLYQFLRFGFCSVGTKQWRIAQHFTGWSANHQYCWWSCRRNSIVDIYSQCLANRWIVWSTTFRWKHNTGFRRRQYFCPIKRTTQLPMQVFPHLKLPTAAIPASGKCRTNL